MSLSSYKFTQTEVPSRKRLQDFVRRNGDRLRSDDYLFRYSTEPQPTSDGRIIIVEAWNEGCLRASHTTNVKVAFARATENLQHHYGRLLGVIWLAPTPYSTKGVSVSIFEGRLPYERMQYYRKQLRMQRT